MRRTLIPALGLGSALTLLVVCFRAVLFDGEQFAFRDAANFYYPLHLRVLQEWRSGRWPLWDAWQNGGQPLLGNPMAAVLYPGKLVYAFLPYAWGTRLYVVGHTAWACLGAFALARSFGVSWAGAWLSGISYAFGAPVLFQYCNVIFLVGAAWVPWGLRAVDRLMRLRQPAGGIELAVVLALEVLGGDPQAAYLTVICGAGYAVMLALRAGRVPAWLAARLLSVALCLAAVWVTATLVHACWRPGLPGWIGPIWMPALLAWGISGGWIAWRRHRNSSADDPLGQRLTALAGASLLALALSAAQLFPVVEFTALSSRVGEVKTLTLSKFSTEPYRLVECFWPAVFGRPFPENRTWIQAIPPVNDRQLWQHSLYLGGLVPLLFLGAAGFRANPTWRAWLTTVATVSLVASFGRFASPLWWLRWFAWFATALGPHDAQFGLPRPDPYVEDGAGSPYSILAAGLPGFGLFRYSSKLFTFTAAAVAVLAGAGWDDAMAGRSRWLARACAFGLAASAAALGLAGALHSRVIALLSSQPHLDALSGPLDALGAWTETQRALAHGVLIYALGLGLALWGPRRPLRAGAIVLVVLTVDLGSTSARLIWTVPQSVFDARPEAVRMIQADSPGTLGPRTVRVHRMALWHPDRFRLVRSADRVRELAEWERNTLQGLNGLPWEIASSVTLGALELDEYLLLFRPQTFPARPEVAQALGIPQGRPITVYPRRSYDLWGARYFLLPVRSDGWGTEPRGYASFVPATEMVYPDPSRVDGAMGRERWADHEDWQILRNQAAYPDAWIVHRARVVAPATKPEFRADLFAAIGFQNDPFWNDSGRRVFDPRVLAWIETNDPGALRGYLAPHAAPPGESVRVTARTPQRIELRARLHQPGIVILSHTWYPGWRLTIDGRPAPILRANRMMRGAAVSTGEHQLVYRYDPWSFRIGAVVSLVGLMALVVLAARRFAWKRGRGSSQGSTSFSS
jgi:hypothetical protein